MGDNERNDIAIELAILKTEFKEKWLAHDKRADERWSDLMEKMHEVVRKMDARPCADHIKLMSDMNGRVKATEAWIDKAGWAIGVVYIAIVGVIIKMIFK